jgi:hypothetical protein
MTWIMTTVLLVAAMTGLGSASSDPAGAADDKMVPMSISFDPYGNPVPQQQQQVYQQPQPVYMVQQQKPPKVPYNEAIGPPNYGNSLGPGPNAIAPEVNPYPRLSHCVITGNFLLCCI